MNTYLLFVVIFLCVRYGFAQVNSVDPKQCLKDENENRRNYAKLHKIGNMVKLEYDKSMKLNPIEGFECPQDMRAQKYKEGVWAFSTDGDRTSDSPLASKFACVQHEKCGFLLLINKGPNHNDQAKGKEAGTACSGKVDDGLTHLHVEISCVSALTQKTPSNTSPDPKDKERQQCLKNENQNRRGYAKMNKIGNMVKLEYDKSMELNPIDGFECPNLFQAPMYKEGVWAFSTDGDRTSDSPLATKFACVQHEKCGFLLLINKGPNHNDQAKGKEAGTACSGKVDDGLCIGSAASAESAPLRFRVT